VELDPVGDDWMSLHLHCRNTKLIELFIKSFHYIPCCTVNIYMLWFIGF